MSHKDTGYVPCEQTAKGATADGNHEHRVAGGQPLRLAFAPAEVRIWAKGLKYTPLKKSQPLRYTMAGISAKRGGFKQNLLLSSKGLGVTPLAWGLADEWENIYRKGIKSTLFPT